MPIVHVRGSKGIAGRATPKALTNIATEVADAAGCSVGDVWCTFTPATETTVGTRVPREGEGILYVDVLARPRETDVLPGTLEAAARAAASSFRVRLDNVWAHVTVLETGTVFAGGRLV
jgi:hypothetical protein